MTLTHLLAILIILCLALLAVLTAQCQQFIIHFPPGEQHLARFSHYTFRHCGNNLNFSFISHSARLPWSVSIMMRETSVLQRPLSLKITENRVDKLDFYFTFIASQKTQTNLQRLINGGIYLINML